MVVVGAGPAGSATAALLARRGRQVVLLDRARFPRSKPCAEYASPGAVALLVFHASITGNPFDAP